MDDFDKFKARNKSWDDYYRRQAHIAPAFFFWSVFFFVSIACAMAIFAISLLLLGANPNETASIATLKMILLSMGGAFIWLLLARFKKKQLSIKVLCAFILYLLSAPLAGFIIFTPPSDEGGFMLLWLYGMTIASLIFGPVMYEKLRGRS